MFSDLFIWFTHPVATGFTVLNFGGNGLEDGFDVSPEGKKMKNKNENAHENSIYKMVRTFNFLILI